MSIDIKKNSREIIRIEDSEYQGNRFVDLRVYYYDEANGENKPTKKGVAIPYSSLGEVIDALKALQPETKKEEQSE
tara:strand:+ start:393 stop:620 length:228 start_codon:yes stop_codon:yes gene_type:complete